MAAYEPVAVLQTADIINGGVRLITYLANDPLQNFLHSDDTHNPAVLIRDDRHGSLLFLQICEQVIQRLRLRHNQRLLDKRSERRMWPYLPKLADERGH